MTDISSTDIKDMKTTKRWILTGVVLALSASVPPSSKRGVCRDDESEKPNPVFWGWKDGRFWYRNERRNSRRASYSPPLRPVLLVEILL